MVEEKGEKTGGKDKLQIFNLHVKANELKQSDKSLKDFWIALQGVWEEIDRTDPNPMKCPEGTQKNSSSVLSVTRIGGPMATKWVPKVPKPRKKRISGRDGLLGVALREGLHFVDEVTTSGTVMLAHGTSEREA
nr:ribonuclease H-like domain-containing protein [Tanacetum cinerariifolium]